MRTPVSRIEKIGGIVAAIAVLAGVMVFFFPSLLAGRFLSLYLITISAPEGIGLSVGDAVEIQGIQVGEVNKLRLDPANEALIECKIYAPFRSKIVEGTEAVLVPPPILGSPKVRLLPGSGPPLPYGSLLHGKKGDSLLDALNSISKRLDPILGDVEGRMRQVGQSLVALQGILDAVNRGEGTAGKLVRDRDLHDALLRAVERLDRTIASLDPMRDRLDEFTGALPALKKDMVESAALARSALEHLDAGLREFPAAASMAKDSIIEARRVIESLQRNFLIGPNLPREGGAGPMAPSTYREPVGK